MSLANVPETHIDQACVQLAYYIHRRASRNLQRQVPSDEPRVALSVRQSKLLASGWPVDGIRMISYTWGHQRAGMVGRQLLCQRPSKRYIMYDTSSNSLQEGSCAPMCESRSRLTSYRDSSGTLYPVQGLDSRPHCAQVCRSMPSTAFKRWRA